MNERVAPIAQAAAKLSVADQLRLMEELWAALSERPETVPVPDWHRDVLDQRLAEYQQDPTGRPWPDVKSEILRKLGK